MATVFTGIPYDKAQHYCDYGSFNVFPRGTHVLDRRDLYYKDGASDKVYVIVTSQKAQGHPEYYVDAFYGRRGANLQHQAKGQTTNVQNATSIASKLVSEKKAKGYVDFILGTPNTVRGANVNTAPAGHHEPWPPLLTNPAYQGLAGSKMTGQGLIEDTLWVVEEFLPGPRCYVYVDASGGPITIMVENNLGTMQDATLVLGHVESFFRQVSFSKNFVLDGHLVHRDPAKNNPTDILDTLMNGSIKVRKHIYVKVTDLPYFGNQNLSNVEWKDRRAFLTGLFNDLKQAINEPSWNAFDDSVTTFPVFMHRYAYLKKEEFVIGKPELVFKHIRGKYKPVTPGVVTETKDKWFQWKAGVKRGSRKGNSGSDDADD